MHPYIDPYIERALTALFANGTPTREAVAAAIDKAYIDGFDTGVNVEADDD